MKIEVSKNLIDALTKDICLTCECYHYYNLARQSKEYTSQLITVEQASKLLSMTVQAVYQLIKKNKLRSIDINKKQMIYLSSINEYLNKDLICSLLEGTKNIEEELDKEKEIDLLS